MNLVAKLALRKAIAAVTQLPSNLSKNYYSTKFITRKSAIFK